MRSTTYVVALIAGMALFYAGCASNSGDSQNTPETYVSEAEWYSVMVDCMQDRGWPVELDDDGGFGMSVPEDQSALYDEAVEECTAEVGVEVAPLSETELRDIYDGHLEVVSCLEEIGILVTAPSWSEFQSTTGENGWHPYNDLSDSEFSVAFQECPPAELQDSSLGDADEVS